LKALPTHLAPVIDMTFGPWKTGGIRKPKKATALLDEHPIKNERQLSFDEA